MTSIVYEFAFGPPAAGLNADVVDAAGEAVDGSPITLDSSGGGALTLDAGWYAATTTAPPTPDGQTNRLMRVVGVMNVPASIENAALLP